MPIDSSNGNCGTPTEAPWEHDCCWLTSRRSPQARTSKRASHSPGSRRQKRWLRLIRGVDICPTYSFTALAQVQNGKKGEWVITRVLARNCPQEKCAARNHGPLTRLLTIFCFTQGPSLQSPCKETQRLKGLRRSRPYRQKGQRAGRVAMTCFGFTVKAVIFWDSRELSKTWKQQYIDKNKNFEINALKSLWIKLLVIRRNLKYTYLDNNTAVPWLTTNSSAGRFNQSMLALFKIGNFVVVLLS